VSVVDAVEIGSLIPSTTEHPLSYASSHPILDQIPARGITTEEHDAWVATSGRAYTDRYATPHQGEFTALSASAGTTRAAQVVA
jgi:hypothetical protein